MTGPSPASDEALHCQPEWFRVTLASIGDAVITTDTKGGVTFLNSVAAVLDRLDAGGRSGPTARQRFPHHQRREPPARSRVPPSEPCGRAWLSGWRTTACSSPKTARNDPLTTVPPRSATTKGKSPGSCWCSETSANAGGRSSMCRTPSPTPTTSLRPCESRSSFSTRSCGSRRRTGLSTGPFHVSEGGNGRPLPLRLGQRPVEHSSPADAAGGSAVEQPSHS